ncbi:MAG: hypothetical protein JXR25_00265 [Pontiellaceae bacterium]|nr:hypothetical protein [Pontiellaceae bacterium]MBN2783232.1 hypothetical protein [Pontiellaceae bacterium]
MSVVLQGLRGHRWRTVLAAAVMTVPLMGYSDTVTQIVDNASSTDWNGNLWGDSYETPISGNDYITVSGLRSAVGTGIGAPDATTLLRFYSYSTAFEGDTLTLVGNTELLLKTTSREIAEANIILDGGDIRLAADGGGAHYTTVTGTVHVASDSWIGVNNPLGSTLTLASTLTGSAILHVGFGQEPGIVLIDADLSDFSGTLELGGGSLGGTLDFAKDCVASNTVFSLKNPSSDFVNLTNDVTFLALNYGTNSLPVGTYTAQQINEAYVGNGVQFTGTNGTLTVLTQPYAAPAPSENTNLVVQVVAAGSSDSWNGTTIWGGLSADPDKDYFSAKTYGGGQGNYVNYSTILGRVRALATDTNFNGNSLTMVDDTELLLKGESGFTNTCSNLIVEGALLRYSPNSGTSSALAGNLTVSSNSVIGIEQTGACTLTIASDIHGAGNLELRAGRSSQTLVFSGDLSDYTGDLLVSGGQTALTLDFDRDYDLPDVDLIIEESTNMVHILTLDQNIKFSTFTFGTNALPSGTSYTAEALNTFFGTQDQFVGEGSLEVYGGAVIVPTIDPVITAISVSGSEVTLYWTAEDIGSYSIDRKSALTGAEWVTIASNLPAGDFSTNVTVSGSDVEFYRITGE